MGRRFDFSLGQRLALLFAAAAAAVILPMAVRLASTPASTDSSVRTQLELATVAGLAVLVLVGLFGTRALRRRVRALEDAARALALGDLAAARTAAESGPEPRHDELGRTQRALAFAAEILSRHEAGLTESARLSTALASSLDAARIAEEGLRPIAALSDAQSGLVYVLDPETSGLKLIASWVPRPGDPTASSAGRVAAQALRSRTPLVVQDLPDDGSCRLAGTVMAIPMVQHDRPVGVLCLGCSGTFSAEAAAFAQAAARPLGLSLQNALLHRHVERLALELQQANERLQERNAQLEERNAEVDAQNARLRQQAEELAAADRRKSELLAAVAHEVRNPLAAIATAVRLMEEDAGAPGVLERARAIVGRQSAMLSRLVEDLLDTARVGRGQLTLNRKRLDLLEVARHASEAAAPALRAKGHAFELVLPEGAVWVDGDPVRLQQILGNLLHNAAKYTDAGGHLRLEVWRDGDEAVVRVADDGIGLAPESLATVFDLFMQVDRRGARSEGGLGIGLALVRDLTELHGGRVTARSAGLNRGSEFEVRLPAADPPPCAVAEAPARCSPGGGALRVLVLDDDPDLAASMTELLRGWGHEVEEHHDGRSAIAAALARPPDCVLMDIGMSGLDGYQVARELRSKLPRTRLIALTGYGRPSDRRRALEAGFDLHFAKPVDFDVLRAALEGSPRSEAAALGS